jgi:hypothetical protein
VKKIALYFKKYPHGRYYSLTEFRETVEKAEALEVTGIFNDSVLLRRLEGEDARRQVKEFFENVKTYPHSSALPSVTIGPLIKKGRVKCEYADRLRELDQEYTLDEVREAFGYSVVYPSDVYPPAELKKRLNNAKVLKVKGLRKYEELLPELEKQYALNQLRKALENVAANFGRGSLGIETLRKALREAELLGADTKEFMPECKEWLSPRPKEGI